MIVGYNGNQNLKKSDVPIEWTGELLREYARCASDPVYFAKNYMKIVHLDKGLVPFDMYDYQEEIVEKISNNRRVSVLTARQSGKCVINNTIIRLRNKETGEIIETTVEEFYESQKNRNYTEESG